MNRTDKQTDLQPAEAEFGQAIDYRLIFDACTNPMAFSEAASGKIVDVNAAWMAATGIAREAVIGRTALELGLWPNEAQRSACLAELETKGFLADYEMKLILRSVETPHRASARLVHMHGARYAIWEFRNVVLEKQAEEKVSSLLAKSEQSRRALLSMLQDVKRAEEALRQSEAQLATAMRIARLGHWELDVERGIFTFSDSFYAIFHTTAKEAGGYQMSIADYAKRFVHPADSSVVGAETRKASEASDPTFNRYLEHRMLYADGGVGHIAVHYFVVKDPQGKTIRLYGVNQDITERKRTETALSVSQERLRAIVSATPSCIKLVDSQGTLLEINPCGLDLVEAASAAEVIGRPLFGLIAPEHRESFAKFNERICSGHDGTLEFEMVGLRGTRRWMQTHAVPLQDPASGKTLHLAITDDITDRKRVESQLRQAQKLEAVGQLAGGIAHDFNNILAAIMMNLTLLQDNDHLDGETRAGLKEVESCAERATRLTRQLLMFSRRSVLETRVLDVNEVVDNLLKMLGRLLGEHIKLVFERSNRLPPVEADAGMLEQVLMNLAVNARDAMPKGGQITISTSAPEISAADAALHPERRRGSFVCLAVADTGCGMDPATVEHIFEPFFTTKEAGKGTGLGLATVHGIVAQHRGWVEVDSRVGGGTTFRAYLPVSTTLLKEDEEQSAQPALKGSETLLVVEDEDAVRLTLARALRGLDYRVLEAANGQDALKLWRDHGAEIDLLLTDMVMPEGMTGLELAERIRLDKPALKVIISSGYAAEITESATLTKAGIVYLPKPYKLASLGRALRECLERK